jgi:hypothetical protein
MKKLQDTLNWKAAAKLLAPDITPGSALNFVSI